MCSTFDPHFYPTQNAYSKRQLARAALTWRFQGELVRLDRASQRSSISSLGSIQSAEEQQRSTIFSIATVRGSTQRVALFPVLTAEHVSAQPSAALLADVTAVRLGGGGMRESLARFQGIYVDDMAYVVMEAGDKGSLADVYRNANVELDSMFKYCLLRDVSEGVTALHRGAVGAHGRLTSSACIIDDRFVCKITDYGMPSLRNNTAVVQSMTVNDQLHLAPEVLRSIDEQPSSAAGKQKKELRPSDIYAMGIIIGELVSRLPPFETLFETRSVDDIVKQLRAGTTPPVRPEISPTDGPAALLQLMRDCLMENAFERPTGQGVVELLGEQMESAGIAGGSSLTDQLVKRLSVYARNLEQLVAEKTAAFFDEKERAERLLYSILPSSVARRLIDDERVEPEAFDSVTIYFSDIVDFTQLAATSTPFEVVRLLNDVYTLFDDVIRGYDVYKVETIGDAYMAVSGLPVRNGHEHALVIARLSVRLLSELATFRVEHRPDERLRLRIGAHSGPCAAGVVGMAMPRYCLFGDTVNVASRMESLGMASHAHISYNMAALLGESSEFRLLERGLIEVKGKGAMKTFWLLPVASIGTSF